MARRDYTGAVDFPYLEGFAAGDLGVVAEVLDLFCEQAQMWSRLLDPSGDSAAWRDGAHTLKGSALGIGAGALGTVCGEAEAAWQSSPALKEAIKTRLDHTLDLVLADIAAWRHEQVLQGLK